MKFPAQRKHGALCAFVKFKGSGQRGGCYDQGLTVRYELRHPKAGGTVVNEHVISWIQVFDRFHGNGPFFCNMLLCTGSKRHSVNILFSGYGGPAVGADSLSLGHQHVNIPAYGHFRDMKKTAQVRNLNRTNCE